MEAAHAALESKIGYRFRRRELLQRALTHRSSLEGRTNPEAVQEDNEQLEFLGDAVLGFVVSEALVRRYATAKEGQLSRWKAHLVSATHLHRCAVGMGLGEHLLLGRGEERNGGRERRTLLADAFEALIAALYLDGGMEAARLFIETNVLIQFTSDLEELSLSNNQKVDLQQRARTLGLPAPHYSVVGEEGPDHAKVFIVEARLGDKLTSRAKASTKRNASLLAAKELLELLDTEPL
jgi:ribonuclease III